MLVVSMPRRPAGRAGSRAAACPGVATTSCTLHFENATTSGGACADQLWTLESAAVTRHLNHCGRHESRCLPVIIDGGITSLVRQCLSAEHLGLTEETAGLPKPALGAIAAPATRDGRLAPVGLATDAGGW
jgi:hypothetical protein